MKVIKKSIQSPGFVVLLLSILTLAIALWFYPGNVVTGDAGYKYLETRDLLIHGPTNLSCSYPGRDVDPSMKYIPFREPFVYLIKGQCFFVFPFQLAFVYAPFYFLGGIKGIYAVSFLSTVGILLLLVYFGRLLELEARRISILVALTWIGAAVVLYGVNINEYAMTALLVTAALVLLLNESPLFWILSGALAGLSLFFRAETASLIAILPASLLLSGTKDWFRRTIFFGASFTVLFAVFLLTNYMAFGYLLGLRSIVFMEGQHSTILERFLRIFNYWIGNNTSIIRETPLLLLAFVSLYNAKKFIRPERIRYIIYATLAYTLIIPFFVANYPGPQYGERFIYSIYPLMGFAGFASLTLFVERKKWILNTIATVLLLLTVYQMSHWLGAARKTERGFNDNMTNLLEKSDTRVVVLRQLYLANIIFTSYYDRVYFLASDDAGFNDIVSKLRNRGVHRITVLHSRPPFRGARFNLPETLVPKDFKYASESKDLGTDLYEMRMYDL